MNEPANAAPPSSALTAAPTLERISPAFDYVVVSSGCEQALLPHCGDRWLRRTLAEKGLVAVAVLHGDGAIRFEGILEEDPRILEEFEVSPEEQRMLDALREKEEVHGAWLRARDRQAPIPLENAVEAGLACVRQRYLDDGSVARVSFFSWGDRRICVVYLDGD